MEEGAATSEILAIDIDRRLSWLPRVELAARSEGAVALDVEAGDCDRLTTAAADIETLESRLFKNEKNPPDFCVFDVPITGD